MRFFRITADCRTTSHGFVRALLWVIVWGQASAAWAQIVFRPDQKFTVLNTDFSWYCQPVALNDDQPQAFKPSRLKPQAKSLNLGYLVEQGCWLGIDIQNPDSQPRSVLLEHNFSQTDRIRVWQLRQDQGWLNIGQAGIAFPIEQWPRRYRLPTFAIQLEPGLNRLRIHQQSHDLTTFDWNLWDPAQFQKMVDMENLLLGGFFAICLVLSFYNLVIFRANRDPSHFFYVLYLSCYTLPQMFLTGLLKLYIMPNESLLLSRVGLTSVLISIFFTYLFIYYFLRLGKFPKFLNRVYLGAMGLALAGALIALLGPHHVAGPLCMANSLLVSTVALTYGVIAIWRKVAVAKIFLVAWTFLILGNAFQVFLLAGVIEANIFSKSANFVGAVVEAILISYALAFKMKMERAQEVARRRHAYSQLEKMVYPHQLTMIKEGLELEQTMPLAKGEACVLCVDVINSSKQNSEELKILLLNFFDACQDLMNQHYDERGLSADGFRIKEMGDGFLCSVGFPFALPQQVTPQKLALDMALSFIEKFELILQKRMVSLSFHPKLSIGIAEGSIEGFFTLSGIRSYELFGRSIILATRYEALRKQFPIQGDEHIICLQQSLFQFLDTEQQKSFQCFTLDQKKQRIRDDENADRFYYRTVSAANQRLPLGA